jgi:uncharacterized protein (DUF58 family)
VSPVGPILPDARANQAQAHRRWPVAFGPRFFVLLLVGLVWLGPAWWDARFLYAMALWDLLALGVWLIDLRHLPRPYQLEVRRIWVNPPALATPGQNRIEVINRGEIPLRVTVVDDVPPALRDEPAKLEMTAPPARAAQTVYSILPRERGEIHLGNIYLRYQSAWGLAERWAAAELGQTVRVYPSLQEAKRHMIYLIRSRQIELEKRLKRQRGLGREFENLREYRDGDELRDVCWTATARRGKLITKVYQVERSQAVWLVLDVGRLLRAKVRDLAKLDYAVNTALALAQVALYSGDRVGLLAYGRTPQHLLGAGRGSAHLRALLDRLALVRAQPSEADHLRAAETLLSAQKQRGLMVWITDFAETPATPDVIESALQLMRRHLVLFVAIGQPEMAELAGQRPEDSIQMFRSVAALEMVQRRDLLLRRLRQRGALTLETEAEKLSTAVVNHYLQIKERALL